MDLPWLCDLVISWGLIASWVQPMCLLCCLWTLKLLNRNLVVQQLRLCAPNAGDLSSGNEIPHAATKTWYSQINKCFLKKYINK